MSHWLDTLNPPKSIFQVLPGPIYQGGTQPVVPTWVLALFPSKGALLSPRPPSHFSRSIPAIGEPHKSGKARSAPVWGLGQPLSLPGLLISKWRMGPWAPVPPQNHPHPGSTVNPKRNRSHPPLWALLGEEAGEKGGWGSQPSEKGPPPGPFLPGFNPLGPAASCS